MSEPATPRALPEDHLQMLERWRPRLQSLCDRIRGPVRDALRSAHAFGGAAHSTAATAAAIDPTRAVGAGAGDTTFAIDVVAEEAVEAWFLEVSRREPVSLLTEDAGWRHRGPSSPAEASGASGAAESAGSMELDGFDHGGPRIALDPIDGTRNVMHDLRSAWVVVSYAGPGASQPVFGDLEFGAISELPDTRGAVARELEAIRGHGAVLSHIDLVGGAHRSAAAPLFTDSDVRFDRGYFPFFSFHPSSRAAVEALGSDVFRRLAVTHSDLNLSTVFNDQYISSGGQLALLALGTYRSIVDARDLMGMRTANPTQTAKPYDMAGAALVAIEAGCPVTQPDGTPLDFPIDVTTSVDFAGFRNQGTADAMLAALRAACEGLTGS